VSCRVWCVVQSSESDVYVLCNGENEMMGGGYRVCVDWRSGYVRNASQCFACLVPVSLSLCCGLLGDAMRVYSGGCSSARRGRRWVGELVVLSKEEEGGEDG